MNFLNTKQKSWLLILTKDDDQKIIQHILCPYSQTKQISTRFNQPFFYYENII